MKSYTIDAAMIMPGAPMRTHRCFISCRSAVAMLTAVLMAGFLSNPFAIAAPARGKAARSQPTRQTAFATTPPMGWNSWDCYGTTVTEAEVKAQADYMARYLARYGRSEEHTSE